MSNFWNDIRYALRSMRKNPGFTLVIALSLGLGIGANTAIFTLINAIFLQPIPVKDPSRLIVMFTSDPRNPGFLPMSYLNYVDYRDKNTVFSGLAASTQVAIALRTGAEPQQLLGELVSGNYFDVLGATAWLGRTFQPEEDGAPGANPVVVLSHAFWTRQFGANRNVLGQKIVLNGYPYTIVGVARPNFQGINAFGGPALWAPLAMHAQLEPDDEYFISRRFLPLTTIGRLKPGIGERQAQAALQTLAKQLEREYPDDNRDRGIKTLPLAQSLIDPNGRRNILSASQLLMTVVGLVLLIACANVANLLLVRSAARRKEIAVRLSIGASSRRLIQQLLTESVVLALLGGILGLLIAAWGKSVLWSFRPPLLAEGDLNIALDVRVLLFTLALSIFTGLLFGLAPAIRAARPDLVAELKERGSQAVSTSGWFNLRNALVVAQVAFSLVALIGSGLFLRSMRQAENTDLGFDSQRLGRMIVNPGEQGYTPERAQIFYRQVIQKLEATPGIVAAAVASSIPLAPAGLLRSVFLEGQDAAPGNRGVLVLTNDVSPHYFRTLGIPVERGRGILESDQDKTRRITVINETMAKKFWPTQNPIGQRFRFFSDRYLTEVVGVVKDSKYTNIAEDPLSCAYLPEAQIYSRSVTVVFRSSGDPSGLLGTARNQVASLDHALLITNVSAMQQLIDQSLWAQRMGASLLAIFGFLALGLSAIGMYGVMAYSVAQRTNEIGIRMALGARGTDVFGLVLQRALGLVTCGVVLGLLAAYELSGLIGNLLFGVHPTDIPTFLFTSLLLIAVATVATLLPARRALAIDPLIALRAD